MNKVICITDISRGRMQWTMREIFEEDAKDLHWVTSAIEFSDAAETGEPFQAKGNPNAHANTKSKA